MHKTFIIAEIGVNHNGDLDLAEKMVDLAAEAGVDAVKFQTFNAGKVASRFAPKADYQKEITGPGESQLEMLKKLELDKVGHQKLLQRCKKKNVMFISSPFDDESIKLLDELGIEIFKIPSGEIINWPYLRKMGALKKRIILSSGMATLGEIEEALDLLVFSGTEKENITVLHCNTEYPSPYEDVNLHAMITIKKAFNIEVGYSDHTPGIEIPIAAVAMGARIIEKHFTTDRSLPGPDHRSSLEPEELRTMVKAIRNVERALGNGIKKPSPSELKNRGIARKSIVASRAINAGEEFCEENLAAKRPGTGICAREWDRVIGRRAPRNFELDEAIEL